MPFATQSPLRVCFRESPYYKQPFRLNFYYTGSPPPPPPHPQKKKNFKKTNWLTWWFLLPDYLNPFHAYDEGNLSWLVRINIQHLLCLGHNFCAFEFLLVKSSRLNGSWFHLYFIGYPCFYWFFGIWWSSYWGYEVICLWF